MISYTTDAFVCSLMLAAAERSAFLARTAPTWLLPGARGRVTEEFRTWVRYHQHHLRIVQKINKVYGPMIFITHVEHLLSIIVFSFGLFRVGDKLMAFMVLVNIMGTLIQLFLISRAGQTIIDNSVQLSRSVVGVAQVARGGLGAGPARSALSVVVTRLSAGNGVDCVCGLGFFVVSLDFFQSMLHASVSYIIFLLHFRNSGPRKYKW